MRNRKMANNQKVKLCADWDQHYQMWRVKKLLNGVWVNSGTITVRYYTKSEAEAEIRKLVRENPDYYESN
jgi:hypothetical protein